MRKTNKLSKRGPYNTTKRALEQKVQQAVSVNHRLIVEGTTYRIMVDQLQDGNRRLTEALMKMQAKVKESKQYEHMAVMAVKDACTIIGMQTLKAYAQGGNHA